MPKVQHKPIKSPERVQKERSKINRMLPWSGAPESVRCTREINYELLNFGFWESHSAIIHRTVRCSIGLSGVPYRATATAPTVLCKSEQ
jgi:hypothetical protein